MSPRVEYDVPEEQLAEFVEYAAAFKGARLISPITPKEFADRKTSRLREYTGGLLLPVDDSIVPGIANGYRTLIESACSQSGGIEVKSISVETAEEVLNLNTALYNLFSDRKDLSTLALLTLKYELISGVQKNSKEVSTELSFQRNSLRNWESGGLMKVFDVISNSPNSEFAKQIRIGPVVTPRI